MSRTHVSEPELFRATSGLDLRSNVKRTLAHCLFWMQHATHEEEGMPAIWKTGPELEVVLAIAARTANRHLKILAAMGFWSLAYKPKPGTIGKVSWLTLSTEGAKLIDLAREISARDHTCRVRPTASAVEEPTSDTDEAHQASLFVTSKQSHETEKTAKKPASFILSGKAKKEALKTPAKSSTGYLPKPPKYLKIGLNAEPFALLTFGLWKSCGLKTWDWSSRFTWTYIDEIVGDLQTRGLTSKDDWATFLSCILKNWSWMRTSLRPRYAHHETNLHAPSPMALAHEFDHLFSMFEEGTKAAKKMPIFSSLEEGLD